MSKDALEGMSTILRENGYEVTKKELEIDAIKSPYKRHCFNEIESFDLRDIDGITCVFLTERGHEELNHGGDTSATEICIGCIMYYEDADENLKIYMGYDKKTPLKNFKYVTRLDDLIASLINKEKYFD